MQWQILQTDRDEYVLMSDSDTIQKVKGKHASDMVAVLQTWQSNPDKEGVKIQLQQTYDKEYAESLLEWLHAHCFIVFEEATDVSHFINIIGYFSDNFSRIRDFTDNLPSNIAVNRVVNIADVRETQSFLAGEDGNFFTLIVAPFWFDTSFVTKIVDCMLSSEQDFLCM